MKFHDAVRKHIKVLDGIQKKMRDEAEYDLEWEEKGINKQKTGLSENEIEKLKEELIKKGISKNKIRWIRR